MLISLSSLVTTSKFQKNFCFKMRAVGPINIKNVKVVAIYESGLFDRDTEIGNNIHLIPKWPPFLIFKRIFNLESEAIRANLHGNNGILKLRPFWNKAYDSRGGICGEWWGWVRCLM